MLILRETYLLLYHGNVNYVNLGGHLMLFVPSPHSNITITYKYGYSVIILLET